jgi:organic hydroperoxide reductase OsmC/OhrA
MPKYETTTVWAGGHVGELCCGNGARISFSAPEGLHGQSGVLTPEDAFVGALNMCFMLMFIWSVEKFNINLVSYKCTAEGLAEESLDRTSAFTRMVLRPRIEARNTEVGTIRRALKLAKKYSLILQSIKAKVAIEPEIIVS